MENTITLAQWEDVTNNHNQSSCGAQFKCGVLKRNFVCGPRFNKEYGLKRGEGLSHGEAIFAAKVTRDAAHEQAYESA